MMIYDRPKRLVKENIYEIVVVLLNNNARKCFTDESIGWKFF